MIIEMHYYFMTQFSRLAIHVCQKMIDQSEYYLGTFTSIVTQQRYTHAYNIRRELPWQNKIQCIITSPI